MAHKKLAQEHMEFKEEIPLLKGALSIAQHQLKGKKDRKRRREKKDHKHDKTSGGQGEEGQNEDEAVACTSSSQSESETSSTEGSDEEEEEQATPSPSAQSASDVSGSTTPAATKKSVLSDDMIHDIIYCISKSVSRNSSGILTPYSSKSTVLMSTLLIMK